MKKLFAGAAFAGLICMNIAFGVAAAADGKTLYAESCAGCHGPDAAGRTAPALKGQAAADLMTKLEGYKAGTFGGAKKNIMQGVVKNRTVEDLKAIADYLGTLK